LLLFRSALICIDVLIAALLALLPPQHSGEEDENDFPAVQPIPLPASLQAPLPAASAPAGQVSVLP
jgi:hypothetical protein